MPPTQVEEAELRLKATQTISELNKLTTATNAFSVQLTDVLDKLDKISKQSLGKTVDYFGTVNNTNNSRNYKFGASKNLTNYAVGDIVYQTKTGSKSKQDKDARDAVIASLKKEADLKDALIAKEKELAAAVAERNKIQQQNANTAAAIAVERKRSNDIRQYKVDHPELFGPGSQNRNWRYQTGRGFETVGNYASSMGTAGRIAGDVLSSAGALIKAPALGVTTIFAKLAQGMTDFAKSATQAYAEIESIKTQLGVVFSSQSQADSMFGEISQYAVKSPFSVQQTSEMAVLLKQSGVYASDLMKTLRMIGDTAGGNMEKMKRIANNYAQIVSIGKASMLDMRQFAYAGIPIFEAVSKELNVSQQELRKLISDGKVTSDIIEKVFKDLTGINGIFENATEKGAKTIKARLQNLGDIKQIAMGSWGDRIVNAGTTYGKDSTFLNLLTKAEDFFTWIKEHADVKNIERDVKAIKDNRNEQSLLNDLIEQAKENNDKELAKVLEKRLKELKNTFDVDERRSYNANAYDIYNKKYNEYREKYKDLDESKLKGYISEYNSKIQSLTDRLNEYYFNYQNFLQNNPINQDMSEEERNKITKELDFAAETYHRNKQYIDEQILAYQSIIKDLYEYDKAIKLHKKTTDEMTQADKERSLEREQQARFDNARKNADREGTYANAAEKLYSLYRDSEEYKKEQEEKQNKLLKETQAVLKELSPLNKGGRFDISGLKYSEIVKYTQGDTAVLTPSRKLDLIEGKSASQKLEDRKILEEQWKSVSEKIAEELTAKGLKNTANKILAEAEKTLNVKNIDKFYKEFGKSFEAQVKTLEGLSNADEIINVLFSSTWLHELMDKGVLATVGSDGKNGIDQSFQALYKRILASNLGIPATAITGTNSALKFYNGNIASRNMTGNVLGTAVSNGMSIAEATKMISSTGVMAKLRDDLSKGVQTSTYQIDWEQVSKNIKDFSLQIKTSTEVVKSYKKSLEDQRNTYINLFQDTYKTGETNGKKSTWISSKWLEQNEEFLSEDEIGVNAFGERLIDEAGRQIAKVVNGKAYYTYDEKTKTGEEATGQLYITGNIYELLDKYLKNIDKQLAEANKIEAKSAILETERNRALEGNALTYLKLSNFSNRDFIDRNSESIMSLYQTRAESYLKNTNTYGGDYQKFTDAVAAGEDYAVELMHYFLSGVYSEIMHFDNPEQLKAFAAQAEKNRLGSEELSMKDRYDQMINKQSHYGLGANNGYITKSILSDLDWDKDTDLSTLGDNLEEIQKNFSVEWLTQQFDKLGESIENVLVDSAKLAYISPFEKLGEDVLDISTGIKTWEDYADDLGSSVRSIAGDLTKQTGQLIQQAGFSIVTASAMEHNWGGVAAGLLIAAAGGFASGIGNWIGNKNSSKEDDDKTQKMQSLTDQLKELLAQARADALYYEKNLRHKTALGLNEQFSYKSVNDAIITKKGDVIETSPEDYLIATKTPQVLGNNTVVQPNINFNVIDNVGVQVRQEKRTNPDGSIDIVAVIENAVGEYIASSKSDDAFNAREYRLNGRTAIM